MSIYPGEASGIRRDPDIEVPNAPTPTQGKVRKFFINAYERAVALRNASAKLGSADDDLLGSEGFINVFENSLDFQNFYVLAEREAIGHDVTPYSEDEFRGALFAGIATNFIKHKAEKSGKVAIASVDVLHALQIGIQNPDLIVFPYAETGIRGCYVPDLILMEEIGGRKVITTFCEISLSDTTEKYLPQIRGYYALKEAFGPIAQPAKFLIVTPQVNHPIRVSSLDLPVYARLDDITTMPVPLSPEEFAAYSERVKKLYRRNTDYPTIEELRAERTVQSERTIVA